MDYRRSPPCGQAPRQHNGNGPGQVEHLYCPATFDPELFLPRAQWNYGDSVVYLAHCIIMGRVRDRRCPQGGFVPLKNRFMRNVIGRRWEKVKSLAVQTGLVEVSESYRPGVRSQGYRLRSPHAEAEWVLRPVSDGNLIRRLRDWRNRREREEWRRIRSGQNGVPAAVWEYLYRNLQKVQIDRQIPEALTREMGVAVDLIRRGRFFWEPDRHGRLHTNITNLKRSLRAYLSVNGQRLINLDIASSQPLFLGLLALTDCRDLRTLYPLEREGRRRGEGSSVSICGARTPQSQGIDHNGTDLATYVDFCARGEFYRYVKSESGLELDYDALKQQVFKVLFGRNGRASTVYQVLDRRFPSLMDFIRRVKRGNHRRLAHLGQRAESDFIFGRVVSRLLRERPELFVATIHDSVMTTAGNEQYVRGVMLDEFRKLGVEPTVRVEK